MSFYFTRVHTFNMFIYSIIYVWTFPKLHHAAEISFKNLYQNTYNNSQAAGWHMHANCRIPIRSCFFKSAFVGNVLLLEHFRHFSAHSISNRIFPIFFLMFKDRRGSCITSHGHAESMLFVVTCKTFLVDIPSTMIIYFGACDVDVRVNEARFCENVEITPFVVILKATCIFACFHTNI